MLDIFDCGKFDQYFYDERGEFWIHGGMLATKLGFKNVSQVINMHTKESERQKPENLMGYINDPWFVNESGTWRLILKSRTKTCEEFREKLCTEILPAIRKNGGYISDTATLDQTKVLLNQAQTRLDRMTEELTLSNLKVSQMSDYIQGESDRTKKAKESVTDDAIKEAVVDYVCVTEDQNGDALVFQTYLKDVNKEIKVENENYKRLLATIYDRVSDNKTILARSIRCELKPHGNLFLQPLRDGNP